MSTHVEVTTCPVTLLKHLFALADDQKIVTNTFSRRFYACRLIYITILLVNESVNAVTTTVDGHVDLVILTTRTIKFKTVVRRLDVVSVSSQSITQHQAILDDVELDGVASGLLGSELDEGGGHGWCLSLM